MEIDLVVNGTHERAEVGAGETLLEALRRLGHTSVKDGCANGDCGACAVLLEGRAVTSCLVFAAKADGVAITTIEGMTASEGTLHPLQRALLDTGGVQCGFCTPAMTLTALDLLAHHPHPSRRDIEEYLVGNLCRCTGYVKQVEAIERTVEWMREAGID